MGLNKYHKAFLSHVKGECRRYRIKLILTEEDCFDDSGDTYGGYFDHVYKELGVAQVNEEHNFISTLVHEFSHMEQWIDGDPTFTHRLRGGYESSLIMNKWLSGTSYTNMTVKSAIGIVRDCELNCDRRAIKNIIKYNLDIDIPEYCRVSNAYVLFYNYIIEKRRWEFTVPPSHIDDILKEMPIDLETLDYTNLSNKFRELYNTYLK